jgi:phage gp16-like protein
MKKLWLPAVVLVSLVFLSCRVTLVAPYDQVVSDQISTVSKMIDKMYLSMAEQDASARQYSQYSAQYINIEVELNSILNKNQSKFQNEHSAAIAENVVKQWLKYKQAHKTANGITDGQLTMNHQYMSEQMNRLQRSENDKKWADGSHASSSSPNN